MADLIAAWALFDLLFAIEALINLALVGGGAWWMLRTERAPARQAEDAQADDALAA